MSDERPRRFRIPVLDGGGIGGTFSAAVLAAWEKEMLVLTGGTKCKR